MRLGLSKTLPSRLAPWEREYDVRWSEGRIAGEIGFRGASRVEGLRMRMWVSVEKEEEELWWWWSEVLSRSTARVDPTDTNNWIQVMVSPCGQHACIWRDR
jgi:hypothetical protein